MNRFVALARAGLLGFAAASLFVSTGCGMDIGVGGTTGTGGHAGGTGGDCSSSSTGGGGSPGTTGSTGTGATPVKCGGFTPVPTPPCAADEFCNYPSHNCGAVDNQGTCTKRPEACDTVLLPTCGCDGQIYENECVANTAGVSANTNGCMPPPGQFACGAHFCNVQTEFCSHTPHFSFDYPDTFTCTPLPVACDNVPASCACVDGGGCTGVCSVTDTGGVLVKCPLED
jgi:hypothetical protein